MKKTIIIILAVLALIVLLQDFFLKKKKNTPLSPRPYVVMLSLDGFRWDYQDKTETPNLDFLTKNGVKADGLQPAFPSKTFPNHYTIATGLYPGNHELISNSFYAPDINNHYTMGDRSKVENGKFYKGEPIWVTAEAQRVKTASYFWVGSEAKIKGYQPTYWKKYDHNFPYEQRIDSVINWLEKPYGERPHLVTWYLDQTDGVGHKFGPDSPEIKTSVHYLDSIVGIFINKLNSTKIKDSVNFIIVSDHGMGALTEGKTIYLEEHMNLNWMDTSFGKNPFALIDAKEDCADSIINSLKKIEGLSVWKKEDIPERFHYKQSKRVSDIVVVADSGWTVTYKNKGRSYTGGTHGYDNTNKDMYGIFYGIGPNFKTNYNAGTLYNVDIYNLIANILEIKPAPNDGTPENIFHVLKE
ncbi:MAG: alkaline phosphatase family protein [Salinivirgaceae bacterium]|nr:alkaline phosphatase family protein [Salinivirgaceae bacterium]